MHMYTHIHIQIHEHTQKRICTHIHTEIEIDRIGILGIQIHNNIAISWDETRNLKLWNLCNGNLELSKGHKSDIYGVKFINNNTFFAWGDTDTSLHIWNINDKTFKTLNIEQAGYLENIHFTDKYFILHTDLSEINIFYDKLIGEGSFSKVYLAEWKK